MVFCSLIVLMGYPSDFSRHRPMTEAEIVEALQLAIRLELRHLKPVHWRKNMSLEHVLREQGVEWFGQKVAERLLLANTVLFRGPLHEDHTAGGQP